MGKFCPQCGMEIKKAGKFCAGCGAKLPESVQPVAPVAVAAPAAVTPEVVVAPAAPAAVEVVVAPAAPEVVVAPAAPKVQATPPVDVIQVYAPNPEVPPVQPRKKKKSFGKVLAAVLGIFLVLVLAVTVIGFLSDNDADDRLDKSDSADEVDEDDSADATDEEEDSTDATDEDSTQNTDDEDSTQAPEDENSPEATEDDDPPEDVQPGQDITRTIMVYIVGSNLESQGGAGTLDIEEMLAADFDTEQNNVLVYTGGANRWKHEDISSTENAIFLVGEDDITKVYDTAAANMADSKTLTDFLQFGMDEYPADRYSLILWNHGGGPIQGYGHDEQFKDMMSLEDLQEAFENSDFGKKEKLEFLGFDACLMGTVETAWVFKDYAQYFVASQETEPGNGWDYRFLNELDQCDDGGDIGKYIIDYYFDFYDVLFAQYPRLETELTLSCVDLSQVDEVEECVEALFSDINEEVLDGQIETPSRCRYKTKAFGKMTTPYDYDLVDLSHLAALLSTEYADEAEDLEAALEDYIVYSRTNVKNANGVSIYHPYDDLVSAQDNTAIIKGLGFAPEYVKYITNFAQALEEGQTDGYRNFSKNAGVATSNGQASDLTMQLTPEQVQTFSSAQYYVFRRLSADSTFSGEVEYLHIFSGQDAVLSADGTLSATYEGKAVFGKDLTTGAYSDCPLSMYQIYDGTGDEKFYFSCMFWYFGENLDMDLQPVNWLMKIKNGKPQLLGAYSMDAEDDNLFPDKYLLDSEDYAIYTFANNSYTTTVDENGNVQFVASGSVYGFEYTKENGFTLELCPLDDKGEYFAVFVVEDIYGNSYTSDFFCLGE